MITLLVNASPKNNGATQEILQTMQEVVPEAGLVCLGDYQINDCLGCKACYTTRACVRKDDMQGLLEKMDQADRLVIAAPSYWADVPGIFKSFIDRCTPYSDTNPDSEHPRLRSGKLCYALALRTGQRPAECEHIIETIAHWCGHMGIEMADSLYFCGIEGKGDIEPHKETLRQKARQWLGPAGTDH